MYLIGEFREKDAAGRGHPVAARERHRPARTWTSFPRSRWSFRAACWTGPAACRWLSVLGAILFGALATAFICWTQHNYRLVTGGMPMFSFWATGVITYEMTMLGAIVATFGWFLWESGLVRKRDRSAPVPEVDPGVDVPAGALPRRTKPPQAIDAMRRAGAVGVQRRGEA